MVNPPDRPDRRDEQKSLAALSACVANHCGRDVRFGSLADMRTAQTDVRFTPYSDIDCAFRHVR